MSPSFSKLKKKAKGLLSRGVPGLDRREAGAQRARVNPTNPYAEEDSGKVDPPTSKSIQAILIYLAVSNGPFRRRR